MKLLTGNDKRILALTSYCGFITFFINTLFYQAELISLAVFACVILPGFTFGSTLMYTVKNVLGWKQLLFIILSGGIYITAAWIATDSHIPGYNPMFFLYASVFGHLALYLLYQLLMRSQISLKAICLSAVFGILSSILPIIACNQNDLTSPAGNFLNTIMLMSIFFTWQFLFGLLLVISRRSGLRGES